MSRSVAQKLVFLVSFSYAALFGAPFAHGGLAFITNVQAGFQQAKTQNKPILLYFHSDRCPPCAVLKRTVFGNPELQESASGVVCILVDCTEPRAHLELRKRFKIRAYPTLLLCDSSGEVVAQGDRRAGKLSRQLGELKSGRLTPRTPASSERKSAAKRAETDPVFEAEYAKLRDLRAKKLNRIYGYVERLQSLENGKSLKAQLIEKLVEDGPSTLLAALQDAAPDLARKILLERKKRLTRGAVSLGVHIVEEALAAVVEDGRLMSVLERHHPNLAQTLMAAYDLTPSGMDRRQRQIAFAAEYLRLVRESKVFAVVYEASWDDPDGDQVTNPSLTGRDISPSIVTGTEETGEIRELCDRLFSRARNAMDRMYQMYSQDHYKLGEGGGFPSKESFFANVDLLRKVVVHLIEVQHVLNRLRAAQFRDPRTIEAWRLRAATLVPLDKAQVAMRKAAKEVDRFEHQLKAFIYPPTTRPRH